LYQATVGVGLPATEQLRVKLPELLRHEILFIIDFHTPLFKDTKIHLLFKFKPILIVFPSLIKNLAVFPRFFHIFLL
jgi:hypothetical protein